MIATVRLPLAMSVAACSVCAGLAVPVAHELNRSIPAAAVSYQLTSSNGTETVYDGCNKYFCVEVDLGAGEGNTDGVIPPETYTFVVTDNSNGKTYTASCPQGQCTAVIANAAVALQPVLQSALQEAWQEASMNFLINLGIKVPTPPPPIVVPTPPPPTVPPPQPARVASTVSAPTVASSVSGLFRDLLVQAVVSTTYLGFQTFLHAVVIGDALLHLNVVAAAAQALDALTSPSGLVAQIVNLTVGSGINTSVTDTQGAVTQLVIPSVVQIVSGYAQQAVQALFPSAASPSAASPSAASPVAAVAPAPRTRAEATRRAAKADTDASVQAPASRRTARAAASTAAPAGANSKARG